MRIQPHVVSPTFEVFEQVSLLLGLDPDDVLEGELETASVRYPGPVKAQQILDLVLTNPGEVDLADATRPAQEEILGTLVAAFFFESLKTFEAQKHAAHTTLAGQAPKASAYLLEKARRSRARSAGWPRPNTPLPATSP